MSLNSSRTAPPASSVQLLAQQFGASGCSLRFSRHAYSGLVVVVRFPQPGPALAFARLAARLAGYGCAVRGPQGAVSVPVAAASPVQLRPRPVRPVTPAVVFVQPAAPAGGKCVAYLASGQPCSRKATRGHYCGTHARQVM